MGRAASQRPRPSLSPPRGECKPVRPRGPRPPPLPCVFCMAALPPGAIVQMQHRIILAPEARPVRGRAPGDGEGIVRGGTPPCPLAGGPGSLPRDRTGARRERAARRPQGCGRAKEQSGDPTSSPGFLRPAAAPSSRVSPPENFPLPAPAAPGGGSGRGRRPPPGGPVARAAAAPLPAPPPPTPRPGADPPPSRCRRCRPPLPLSPLPAAPCRATAACRPLPP